MNKYKDIIENKEKKYGTCRSILIRSIARREQVILIQNVFPTIEKYVQNMYKIRKQNVVVAEITKEEIVNNLKYMFSLKEEGLILFFTDIDAIKKMMEEELKLSVKG